MKRWHKQPEAPEAVSQEPEAPRFVMHLNSPASEWIEEKQLTVSGWLLARSDLSVKKMRIKNNTHYHTLEYGLSRHDVAKAYPDLDPDIALHSGFSTTIQYDEGLFEIEVDLGEGWETARSMQLHYSPEKLVTMLLNPDLAEYTAEHQNLLDNKRAYYHEAASKKNYKRHANDPRLVAFYLPQFHPIEQNDRVWGKGFTEWTNVTAAQPRFVGHQQPILPADLGFYDLRLDEVIKDQIDLAKQHGIYGFCFYYYWFSGKRVLERPLDTFLRHKEWDFNFMIAWANENWTKRWDGLENDVIIDQKYLDSDPLDFIKDVEQILLDPRYITQDGKPVLVVYRGSQLGDPERYVRIWREYFSKKHGRELHIISVLGLDVENPQGFGFDAGIEFEPLTVAKRVDFSTKSPVPEKARSRLLDKNFTGGIADYRQVALDNNEDSIFDFPTYKSIMLSWDNDARKKGAGSTVFYGANPDIYGHWLTNLLEAEAKKAPAPLVFVNAWNEWAEGTMLEPTRHFGHAVLNRTTQVLSALSANKSNANDFPLYGITRKPSIRLAVVVHVFYAEEWKTIGARLQTLATNEYDLFITLTQKNIELIEPIREQYPEARVLVVPNRGRDVLPFLFLAGRLRKVGYQYVLKLHTKRSTHRSDGKDWLADMLNNLLPSAEKNTKIVEALKRGAALIGPKGHYISLERYMGSNRDDLHHLLSGMYGPEEASSIIENPGLYAYFAGSMYWARLDALGPLLDTMPIPEDFDSEKGQIDGTYAHAIERVVSLLPVIDKREILESSSRGIKPVSGPKADEEYIYAL